MSEQVKVVPVAKNVWDVLYLSFSEVNLSGQYNKRFKKEL